MTHVVIGSGIAGITFAEKYRSLDKDSKITLITRENYGYYSRPLLSRGFTKDDIEQSIILKSFDKLRENAIDLLDSTEVTRINRAEKSLTIRCQDKESTLAYDKLILAPGSSAFIPPPFRSTSELFFCLNSLSDLKALRRFRLPFLQLSSKPKWAVIGGGLIGCEVASDLAAAGDPVTIFHAMDRLMERQLVNEDSALLQAVLEKAGVKVLLNQNVRGFSKQQAKVYVETDDRTEFDGLIVACGFRPQIDLAKNAGLATGAGIQVNAYLQTSDEAIYTLGDAAELPNGKLYAYILPIRSQALWLAGFLVGQEKNPWTPPIFSTKAKVHGFEAAHPYHL
jgi:NAD(P)H-nitrite reductase large subunit